MWPGSWAMFTAAVAAFLNCLLHDPDAATTDLADDPVIADLSGSWDGGGKGRGINRPSLLHHDQGREQAANLVHESGVREIVLASEFWRIPLRNSRIRRLHNSPLPARGVGILANSATHFLNAEHSRGASEFLRIPHVPHP